MKVLEDQVTRNTGRKQSPCLNQNILARILLRGASRETRTHEKKQRRATMKRTFLKAAPGSGAESAEVLYRQSHGGVSQDDLWQHTVYSYLFPKTRPVGRATQMKPSSVPLKLTLCLFAGRSNFLEDWLDEPQGGCRHKFYCCMSGNTTEGCSSSSCLHWKQDFWSEICTSAVNHHMSSNPVQHKHMLVLLLLLSYYQYSMLTIMSWCENCFVEVYCVSANRVSLLLNLMTAKEIVFVDRWWSNIGIRIGPKNPELVGFWLLSSNL